MEATDLLNHLIQMFWPDRMTPDVEVGDTWLLWGLKRAQDDFSSGSTAFHLSAIRHSI